MKVRYRGVPTAAATLLISALAGCGTVGGAAGPANVGIAKASVVTIRSFGCGTVSTETGTVIGPDEVVTDATGVAGEPVIRVLVGAGAQVLPAKPVADRQGVSVLSVRGLTKLVGGRTMPLDTHLQDGAVWLIATRRVAEGEITLGQHGIRLVAPTGLLGAPVVNGDARMVGLNRGSGAVVPMKVITAIVRRSAGPGRVPTAVCPRR